MPRKSNTISTAEVHVMERPSELTGKVRFVLRYTINGKPKFETLKNLPYAPKGTQAYKDAKSRANAIADERQTEIRNDMLGYNNRKNKLFLKDWFEKCAERKRKEQRDDSDHHGWASQIRQVGEMVEQYRPGAKLGDVNKDFVRGFRYFLTDEYVIGRYVNHSGQHLAPSTAEKKLQTFSRVINMAVDEGLITNNPIRQLDSSEKIYVPENPIKFVEEEELKRLAETPIKDEKTRQVYLFMCFCALRISDVKSLRWGDIVKRRNHWYICKRQKKTQKLVEVPLPKPALELLPERGNKTDDDLVFEGYPTEQTMNKHLKKWGEDAGVKIKMTLHTGRHTFGTLAFTKGGDLYTTSKLMGHSDIRTTMIYAKVIDEKKEEAVDKLNDILD